MPDNPAATDVVGHTVLARMPRGIAVAGGLTLRRRVGGGCAEYHLRLLGVGADATFAVRNIFAKQYIAFTEPDPDGNSYQPAAEREFFVGLRLAR